MNNTENEIPLVVILGPTASGKTKLAVNLATKINSEIISADSRQVYQGMTIGTGKDYDEYLPFFKKDNRFPAGIAGLHLVDVVAAGDSYNVACFQKDFLKAYQSIISQRKTPILCGGTGMYIEAVLRNYEDTQVPVNEYFRSDLEKKTDNELLSLFEDNYKNIHPNADISTRKRLIRAIEIGFFKMQDARFEMQKIKNKDVNALIFGINIPVEIRRERITKRLHERLENGMIEEVKMLLEKGIPAEKLIFYGLEYKFITEYLLDELSYNGMTKRLEIAIHQFAKRQMTFFRSMERKGLIINWLDGMKTVEQMTEDILMLIKNRSNAV